VKAIETIKEYNPCYSSVEWLGSRTIEEMVNECHRGDWLLWLGQRAGLDIRKLTLAKGLCAQQVEHLMEDQRSKDAVYAAIAFGKGEIDEVELEEAAAKSFTIANRVYADRIHNIACVAACVAFAAARVGACVDALSKINGLKSSVDICREVFGKELIELLKTK